jgi:ATP-dependent Clp protease ATP-binding subunit ClpX
MGKRSMGFRTDETKEAAFTESNKRDTQLLAQAEPQDLIKYGLIPEFVGRLPVMGVLNDLDEDALVEILSKPKNAIVKQYQRLFEFENVKLRFSEDALRSISREAMTRKVGARGLRMILEELMLDLMYQLPSQKRVKDFEVTKEMVENRNVNLPIMEKAG